MSKQVTIETTGVGGFGLPTGQVIAGRGSLIIDLEILDASKDHPVVAALVKDGTLIIDGKGKKKAAAEPDEHGDALEMAEMRQRFDAAFEAVTTELQAEKDKVADLYKAVAERDARIADLEKGASVGSLKAEHHGGGKFNVTEGETVHLSGLFKSDGDAFNQMSPEDKAAYVAAEKQKG